MSCEMSAPPSLSVFLLFWGILGIFLQPCVIADIAERTERHRVQICPRQEAANTACTIWGDFGHLGTW